ncbi:PucR family transcriptional regulator [Nonomuraea sp. NPDC050556]|uniref:PucR family transcriptional regulator n=1 Tax=Nonomuraea sp. NPDC050556 TaxID=3364369 RepID=UPI0037B5EED9
MEIMDRLAGRPGPVADQIVAALVAEIPAYSTMDARVLGAVREIAALYVAEAATLIRERRDPTDAEMAGFAASARARARDGVSLEDVLHALRLGFVVLWRVVGERLADGGRDFDAAMEVGTRFMRYFDLAAGVVSRHYLDERERLADSDDRRQGELIAALLADQEVRQAPRYWALVLSPGSAALVRTLRRLPLGSPVLAVPEGDTVLALWPALPGDSRAALERAHHALGPVLITIAGPSASGLDALAAEARALHRVAAGRQGLFCLEDLLLDALVHQAGGRTGDAVRALADPLTGELRATLAAYIASGLSVRETAGALNVHRNTVLYRLGQIHRLTGRDPRAVTDLFLLHAALGLTATGGGRESPGRPGGTS